MSRLLAVARFSVCVLRAWAVLSVIFCSSCARLPVAGTGLQSSPTKYVGRTGCGPPITYRLFNFDRAGSPLILVGVSNS
jgi:hypothetical protein